MLIQQQKTREEVISGHSNFLTQQFVRFENNLITKYRLKMKQNLQRSQSYSMKLLSDLILKHEVF